MNLRRPAVLKWTGASLCALIFAAWLASGWHDFGIAVPLESGSRQFAIARGMVVGNWSTYPVAQPWHIIRRVYWSRRPAEWRWGVDSWSLGQEGHSTGFVGVALWIPWLCLLLPTVCLFHRDRRAVRWAKAGRCVACGYDVAGLAVCPECGKRAGGKDE